mgnify:CR=1 FL=1
MRKVFLALILLSTISIQAEARISTDQLTEPDYVINNGYSEAMAEQITIQKNRIAGQPAEPLYEKKHNKFFRFVSNVYGYLDPAYDTDERIHHDIHMSPSARDL